MMVVRGFDLRLTIFIKSSDCIWLAASAGLIISEATSISDQGHGWPWAPRIYKPDHVEGWKKVTAAVHAKGGAMFCQLWHMGRVTHSSLHGLQPLAPSGT
jgi:N-ethylmaleimide reductase